MSCPVCNMYGKKVSSKTVKHLIKENFLWKITGAEYFLCMNEECDIAYYSSDVGLQIEKDQIKVPIWFKVDADPKYICYCNNVTEKDIIDAVNNKGARNMKDVIKLTGAMKNGSCEVNHPTGECCSPIIQEVIDKAVEKTQS